MGAQVVHLPAPQLEDLGYEPGRQPVPLPVHARHHDPPARRLRTGGRMLGDDGYGPLVDRGRGVLLRDVDPIGGPLLPDAALHPGDHVQEDILRFGSVLQGLADRGDRGLLVAGQGRVPKPCGQRFRACRVSYHAVNLPLVCPSTALRWLVRGAEIATTAMSS